MKLITVLAAIPAVILLAACEPEAPPPPASTPGAGQGTGTAGPAPTSPEYFRQVVGDRVFFATDQHTLDDLSRQTLNRQAQWLISNADATITVEGHADERGTRQYNLALGARRSNAVQRYLSQQGVASSRIRTVTFGKERPLALCSEERCWSQNRRAVTIVVTGPTS